MSAQAEESEEAPKQAVEQEPAPPSEPAPEEPALQLKLDDAGVEVVPPPPLTPDRYRLEELELRVKRARIGAITSAGVVVVGTAIGVAGAESINDVVMGTGAALAISGIVGLITSGGILAHRKRKLRRLREVHYYRSTDAVEVDTSDDAFLVIVTRKYDGGQLTGASVFIRHTDSGRDASPYVDAVEIDTLEQVIREHKAKLLSGE